jgi:hypothetical protein
MKKINIFNVLFKAIISIGVVSFCLVAVGKSSLNINVGPNTPKGLDINQSSNLTQEVEPFKEPSKIIDINKQSGLTVESDSDYKSNRAVNINKKSVLTTDRK